MTGQPRDRGSAVLLGLALACVVAAFAAVVVGGVQASLMRARLDRAADLSAIAGASQLLLGDEAACLAAGRIAELNGTRLVECQPDVLDLVVTVEAEPPPLVRALLRSVGIEPSPMTAVARAGPAP